MYLHSQPQWMTYLGWALTLLIVLGLSWSAAEKFLGGHEFEAEFGPLQYAPEVLKRIGVVQLICVLLYAIPRTSILGAVLLTAYMGGAIAAHVRIHDGDLQGPILSVVLTWLAMCLREPRLRAILPWRTMPTT